MVMSEALTPYVEKRSFTIAAQVAYFRKFRGHTQKSLALRLGVQQSQIARLENTPDAQWTWPTLQQIAGALDLRVSADLIPK